MEGKIILPKMNGKEIYPGVYAMGEPTPRPDLGPNKLAILVEINGCLCVVELSIKFKEVGNDNLNDS